MRWIWCRISSRFLRSQLARLPLEEVLHLGQHAGGVGAALDGQDGQPRGRVARGAEAAEDHALELALAPGREEGGALHGADLHADAHRGQVARDGLAGALVGRRDREVAPVEARAG